MNSEWTLVGIGVLTAVGSLISTRVTWNRWRREWEDRRDAAATAPLRLTMEFAEVYRTELRELAAQRTELRQEIATWQRRSAEAEAECSRRITALETELHHTKMELAKLQERDHP